ncbi:MAG: metallophosphoesterase [Clostridia bacterium]|nr:metallophosphoesterase [Clostridia bacterium]
MRLAVFSDSHGELTTLHWAMEQVARLGKIDAFIFLGDGANDFDSCRSLMDRLSPRALLFQVKGNNDYYPPHLADEIVYTFGGVKVFMTHGHRYQAKMTDQGLLNAAKARGCRVCLYGHTHRPLIEEKDGILLMNPGALRHTYGHGETAGVVDIDKDGIIKAEIILL